MAVRIRMKRMGRRHRPFYRVCAIDSRTPRDGRVIEELGTYDPMVGETDARARLNSERIDYWLKVGAKPSENVQVLIKKYGAGGTHVQQQAEALQRLQASKPSAPPPVAIAKPEPEQPQTAEAEAEQPAEEGAADTPEQSEQQGDAEATEEKKADAEQPADEGSGESS